MKDRIAQWISASDFGSEGRGFDSHCGRFFSPVTLNLSNTKCLNLLFFFGYYMCEFTSKLSLRVKLIKIYRAQNSIKLYQD